MEDEYLRERKADIEQGRRALAESDGPRHTVGAEPARRRRTGTPAISEGKTRWCWWPMTSPPPTCCSSSAASSPASSPTSAEKTSHTAIVARSLDIPAVVGAREASRIIRQDDWGRQSMAMPASSSSILPPSSSRNTVLRQRQSELERARLARLRHNARRERSMVSGSSCWPTSSCPGTRRLRLAAGAVGVGLFRSEFLFMNRQGDLPGEDEQFESLPFGGRTDARATGHHPDR